MFGYLDLIDVEAINAGPKTILGYRIWPARSHDGHLFARALTGDKLLNATYREIFLSPKLPRPPLPAEAGLPAVIQFASYAPAKLLVNGKWSTSANPQPLSWPHRGAVRTQRPVPRTWGSGPARRRHRSRQHHGHLRPRTPLRHRTTARTERHQGHIRLQFLSEAIMRAALGGTAGVAIGTTATAAYASLNDWPTVVSPVARAGGLDAAIAIGAIAGLLPRPPRGPPATHRGSPHRLNQTLATGLRHALVLLLPA